MRLPSALSDGELSLRQAEALLRLTETAPSVGSRPQFFVWTQGPVHALLPHRVLVCGSWVRQRRALELSVFHSVVVSPPALAWLGDPASALMLALTARWVASGRALSVRSESLEAEARVQSEALLKQLACEAWLVHGVARPQRPHEVESLFVAAAETMAYPPDQADLPHRLLEMLLPCLHATWRRVQPVEPAPLAVQASGMRDASARPALRVQLTEREREILRLAQDGRTNAAIGQALAISPLTVKNHIQKILRKFAARNRAQAVALAMAQGLLGED